MIQHHHLMTLLFLMDSWAAVVEKYSDTQIPNYHHIVAVYHERTSCAEFASVEPAKRWARGAIMKICVLALSVNSITHRRSPVWSSSLAQCDLFTFMAKWGMSCVTSCEGPFLGRPATSQTCVNVVHLQLFHRPQIWLLTSVEKFESVRGSKHNMSVMSDISSCL